MRDDSCLCHAQPCPHVCVAMWHTPAVLWRTYRLEHCYIRTPWKAINTEQRWKNKSNLPHDISWSKWMAIQISKWLAIIHHYVLCSIYPLVIKHVDGKSPMDNIPSKTSIDKGFPSRVWLPQGQLFLAWLYNYVATTSTGSGWQRVFAKCLAGEQLPTALLVNEQQRVFRLLLHCCLRIVLDLAMMISVKNGKFRHIWTKNLRTYAVFINNSSWISYAQVHIASANFK